MIGRKVRECVEDGLEIWPLVSVYDHLREFALANWFHFDTKCRAPFEIRPVFPVFWDERQDETAFRHSKKANQFGALADRTPDFGRERTAAKVDRL